MKVTTTRKLVFILTFGPALIFYAIGFFVAACRIAWVFGAEAAFETLVKQWQIGGAKND